MIGPGFETTDPFTQTRLLLVKGTREMAGRGWVLEVECPEGAGPLFLPHLHRSWTETFEILKGSATCLVGGEKHAMKARDRIVMPPMVVHRHPWNTGSGVLVYRQTNDFGASTPEAVDDVIGAFATLYGLAREGRVGKRGLPKNPLQLVATGRTLNKHGGFDAAMPISLQLALGATLGRFAELLGYRAVYDRYLRA